MKLAIMLSAAIFCASCGSADDSVANIATDVDHAAQVTFINVCGDKLAFDETTTKRLFDVAQANIGSPWEGREWQELSSDERSQWSATLDQFLGNDACVSDVN